MLSLTRAQFGQNLALGTAAARMRVKSSCWNELPDSDRYFIILNRSGDFSRLLPGEYIFPDHDIPQPDKRMPSSSEEVIERLWRDGRIPEWIDITPYEVDEVALYLELRCCGRFTDSDERLYHTWGEGYPPFHLFGPILPRHGYDPQRDGKFDLHCYRDRMKST